MNRRPTNVRTNFQTFFAFKLQRQVVQDARLIATQKTTEREIGIYVPCMRNLFTEEGVGDRAR